MLFEVVINSRVRRRRDDEIDGVGGHTRELARVTQGYPSGGCVTRQELRVRIELPREFFDSPTKHANREATRETSRREPFGAVAGLSAHLDEDRRQREPQGIANPGARQALEPRANAVEFK